ncbi:MAG TPA: hypothetical protein VFK16_05495 [Gemmatimonadaceae bacterium]|jgi:hypothetical protein|nr:hypothetical protein [Gemmatimonadaceae bacterium]
MTRRFLALLLALGGVAALAPAATAQAIAPLPSGVVLRVHANQSIMTGVLYAQSVDSVWLRQRGDRVAVQGAAISQITRVERAHPEYVKSLLVGTALGGVLAAALYTITSPGDRDMAVGFSVIAGAVAGLVFPHVGWAQVPLH